MAMHLRRMRDDMGNDGWVRYSVTGPRGATNLTFIDHRDRPDFPESIRKVMGVDFGHHSPVRLHDWETGPMECDLLGEVQCFYDGSGLRADAYVGLYEAGDEDAIYEVLEREYVELFGNGLARENP